MVIFLEEPLYKDLPGTRRRSLVQSVTVIGQEWSTTILAGFETDGASGWRVLWFLVPPYGPYNAATLLHDWLYDTGECSRLVADQRFLDAMVFGGVHRGLAWSMFLAVRVGGWWRWNKCRKAQSRGLSQSIVLRRFEENAPKRKQ